MSYDDVPTIRDVFRDESKVANLYCAIKWTIWQVGYLLFMIAVPIIAAIALTAYLLVLPFIVLADWAVEVKNELKPAESMEERAERVRETSASLPIARRIYNECPVTIKQAPRWFQRLEDWVDKL